LDNPNVAVKNNSTLIATLAREVKGPLNILGGPGVPAVHELAKLGVARVSVGSAAMRATLTLVSHIADELRTQGTYIFAQNTISYSDANQLMDKT
jgi:2-methylisocitrate lyase-like PEP mutase family enzyme